MSNKTILIIMDGWGKGKVAKSDAILNANPVFVNSLYNQYPNCELITCGGDVGLPNGQMGNSEVGHLNIGAGRIVYQELEKINLAIKNNALEENNTLLTQLKYCKENNKPLHLIGLYSDGGVHSHINHLKALCNIAKKYGLTKVYLHLFTDGRDTDPKSGLNFLKELEEFLKTSVGKIATVIGRYYAMDRDKRWERVQLAYDLLTNGLGTKSKNILETIQKSYDEGITDEFIKPIVCVDENNKNIATIKEEDAVIC